MFVVIVFSFTFFLFSLCIHESLRTRHYISSSFLAQAMAEFCGRHIWRSVSIFTSLYEGILSCSRLGVQIQVKDTR